MRWLFLFMSFIPAAAADTGSGVAPIDWQQRIDAAVRAAEDAEAGWRERIGAATRAPDVDVERLPRPAAAPAPDVGQIAERFQGYLGQTAGDPAPGGLSVFVSLSMPRTSLQRLVAEAERAGATLVLRGMIDRSISKTAIAVHRLIGGRKVAWTIDPDAFRRFEVQDVPVFVLTRAGAQPHGCGEDLCLPASDYVRLAGDVSIEYALDAIDRLQPEFRDQVRKARAGR